MEKLYSKCPLKVKPGPTERVESGCWPLFSKIGFVNADEAVSR